MNNLSQQRKFITTTNIPYAISIFCFALLDILFLLGIFPNPLRGALLGSRVILPSVLMMSLASAVLIPGVAQKLSLGISRILRTGNTPEQEIGGRNPLERIVFIHLLITIFLLFLNTKLLYQLSDLSRSSDDTVDFILVTAFHPLSLAFWTAYKPPLLPLLIRLLGYTSEGIMQHQLLDDVANVQLFISAAAWTVFVLSILVHLKKRLSKLAAFTIILFFSVTLDISMWDRLTLSESLSISFFVLWLACFSAWLYLLYQPDRSRILQILFLVCLTLITFLYANARDTNIYFAVMMTGLLTLWLVVSKQFFLIKRKLFLFGLVIVAAIFLSHSYVYNISNRWHPVIMDLMTDRLADNPDAVAFFEQQGMPPANDLVAKYSYPDFHSFLDARRFRVIKDDGTDEFNTWFANQSKRTYITYLLRNPITTFTEPFRDWKLMLLENTYQYREPNGPLSQRIQWLTSLLYPHHPVILVGLSLLLLGILIVNLRNRQIVAPLWMIVFGLLLTVPAMMILVWVGGSLEIPRHAFQISVQLRLALWLGLIASLEMISVESLMVKKKFAK